MQAKPQPIFGVMQLWPQGYEVSASFRVGACAGCCGEKQRDALAELFFSDGMLDMDLLPR